MRSTFFTVTLLVGVDATHGPGFAFHGTYYNLREFCVMGLSENHKNGKHFPFFLIWVRD
jgi:hypothetical protein